MKALLVAVLGGALAIATPAPGHADEIRLTREQARVIAQRAYRARNFPLARDMAMILLDVDPKDPTALVILAASQPMLGKPEIGSRAGREAWNSTRSRVLRHEAAFFTARAEMMQENYGRAKFWLRRAYHIADTPAQRAASARGFQQLRALSPWQTALSFSVAPTNNLNGGSQSRLLEIDDFFAIGTLSGAAMALSGTVAVAEASASYRLSRSANHETALSFRAYHDFNRLSAEARAQAPGTNGSEFNFALAEVGLTHRIAPKGRPLPDTMRLRAGRTWHGGTGLERYAGLELARTFRFPGNLQAQTSLSGTQRWSSRGAASSTDKRLG
ncbi:MAG TPA: hypothetical protein ENK83_03000, partial [Aliiroseovarius sp.]|nr:hypothetical protein [Aliiroseovarius sp.]